MGGVDNICTDKTGTLTQNKMTIDSLYIEESTHNPVREEHISKAVQEIYSLA